MKINNYSKINLIYFISIISIIIVFALGYLGLLQNEILTTILIQIVVMLAIPMLLYTLLISKSFKKTCSDIGLKKISAKMVVISILLGVVLYIINSYVATVFQYLVYLLGYENISLGTTVATEYNYALLLKDIILSAILPGICEEILHRGIMLMSRKKYQNPRICLIISSILFGLTHLNIFQFFYASILGLLIGFIGLQSDSIFPCMIIHFMNNFLSTYFTYGEELNLPLVETINNISKFILNNFVLLFIILGTSIFLCGEAYRHLVNALRNERLKMQINETLTYLKLENTPPEIAKERLNQMNEIISDSSSSPYFKIQNKNKYTLIDNIFLIGSFILGILITISTFIWGIL